MNRPGRRLGLLALGAVLLAVAAGALSLGESAGWPILTRAFFPSALADRDFQSSVPTSCEENGLVAYATVTGDQYGIVASACDNAAIRHELKCARCNYQIWASMGTNPISVPFPTGDTIYATGCGIAFFGDCEELPTTPVTYNCTDLHMLTQNGQPVQCSAVPVTISQSGLP